MSTNPEQPQANEPAPEESFDELTGVYGWFRRHQKLLLYTAGLFTLLTFSITGSLQALWGNLFNADIERGSIEVNGERADLTAEDYEVGNQVARSMRNLPGGVLLPITAGEGGDSELGEVFAILRRAAIEEGFDASLTEVDRAIEVTRELYKLESAAKLAQRAGFSSTQEYRLVVAEAMRIGTYQRLQVLAADTSDAEVMRKVLRNQKKAAYKVAVWDAEKRQEKMIEESKLTDEELNEWLDEKTEAEKRRMQVFDLPQVKLRIGGVLLAEGEFDAAQWADTVLKDYEAKEAQLRSIYNADLERWKSPDSDETRAFEDADVQAELEKIAKAEFVLNDILTKMREALNEKVKPFLDKQTEAQTDLTNAEQSRGTTLQEKITKENVLAEKEAQLAEKPDDADLKAAVETAKAEATQAADTDFQEEQRVQQMQASFDSAKADVTRAKVDWGFDEKFNELTEGKTGFHLKQTEKLLTSEELSDLDELGLDFGSWPQATVATTVREIGNLGFGISRTSKGAILYQVTEAELTPLKPWEDLKPLIEEAYYSKKATDEVIAKDKEMKETLRRLAKEQMPDFVKEKEDGRQARIDEQVAEWQAEVQAEIAKAEKTLQTPGLGGRAKQIWDSRLAEKKAELENRASKVTAIEKEVDVAIKAEIGAEALKHYGKVLDAAASELGYEVLEIGPLPQKLSSRPRFAQDYDKSTRYVFSFHNDMEEGDAIGPVYQDRSSHVIVCTSVAPLEPSDITRREFETLRKNFAVRQMGGVMASSFTQEALAERYHLEKPVGEVTDPQ